MGIVGEIVRDNCVCMIGVYVDNWMVLGRELIILVGIFLEVVEDGVEIIEEEDYLFILLRCL